MPGFEDELRAALGGRYRLEERVGSGGMAEVWRAADLRHHREVAVKVAGSRTAGLSEAVRREIRLVASLRHPGIIPLYDSGEVAGRPFFIMPLVRGRSLRDVLRGEGPPPRGRALRLLRDVAGALDHAHGRGVVHRDVKPANILVDGGRAVVADFGLGALLEADGAGEEGARGTLRYMSPEQLRGEGGVGPASDVYTLACVAFEVLTGDVLFDGSDPRAVMGRKLQGAAAVEPALRKLPRGTRRPLRAALQVDPDARPGSAPALVEALERAEARRRLRPWVAASGIAVAAVVGLLAGPVLRGGVALDPTRVVVGPVRAEAAGAPVATLAVPLVDYLSRSLQGVGGMQVVPTETALAAARLGEVGSQGDPIAAVARETGAGVVVSADVREAADGWLVQVRVTDAARGVLIAAPPFQRAERLDGGGLDSLLTRVAAGVRSALAVHFDERVPAFGDPSRPPRFPAYQSFSRGLDRYLAGEYADAAGELEDAYAADTTFGAAILYAAVSYSNLGRFGREDTLLARLENAALRLTPFEDHWVRYRRALLSGDRPRALREIREAAARAPGSKAQYNLGIEAMEQGRLAEAVEALEALPVNRGPVRGSAPHLGALALSYHLLGNDRRSLQRAREARRLYPDLLLPRSWEAAALVGRGDLKALKEVLVEVERLRVDPWGVHPAEVLVDAAMELQAHGEVRRAGDLWQRAADLFAGSPPPAGAVARTLLAAGEAFRAAGRPAAAAAVADRLAELPLSGPDRLEALAFRGRLAAERGDTEAAEEFLRTTMHTQERYVFGFDRQAAALISAALGRDDEAVRYLGAGLRAGLPYGAWLHRHPALDAVRNRPDFRAATAPIG